MQHSGHISWIGAELRPSAYLSCTWQDLQAKARHMSEGALDIFCNFQLPGDCMPRSALLAYLELIQHELIARAHGHAGRQVCNHRCWLLLVTPFTFRCLMMAIWKKTQ